MTQSIGNNAVKVIYNDSSQASALAQQAVMDIMVEKGVDPNSCYPRVYTLGEAYEREDHFSFGYIGYISRTQVLKLRLYVPHKADLDVVVEHLEY